MCNLVCTIGNYNTIQLHVVITVQISGENIILEVDLIIHTLSIIRKVHIFKS